MDILSPWQYDKSPPLRQPQARAAVGGASCPVFESVFQFHCCTSLWPLRKWRQLSLTRLGVGKLIIICGHYKKKGRDWTPVHIQVTQFYLCDTKYWLLVLMKYNKWGMLRMLNSVCGIDKLPSDWTRGRTIIPVMYSCTKHHNRTTYTFVWHLYLSGLLLLLFHENFIRSLVKCVRLCEWIILNLEMFFLL